MYSLIKNINNLNIKSYKIINKRVIFLLELKKNYKNSLITSSKLLLKHNNLKMFDFSKYLSNYIFFNKNASKKLFFLIINQNTFNLKINTFSKFNNFFFSVGIILMQLKLFKKKLRKSLKSYRLLFSYLNNKLNHNKINQTYVLLKNSKKNSFVANYVFKLLNLTNIVFFYKPNNYVNTNIQNKRSIKKKIKKKLIIKNNQIL